MLVLVCLSIVVPVIAQVILLKSLGKQLSAGINEFIENLNEQFINPTTKRAMSIVGKMGGDAKAVNAIKGKLAKGFIDQNYGVIKIVAEKVLGVDVDDLIDEYGAGNILTAIQDFAPKLGLDLSKGLKGLNIGENIDKSGKAWYE